MVTVDPLADSAFLSTSDGSGCWTWAGVRLSAEGRIEATQRFADLSWDERRKRLTEQETAWLAAQWHAPAPGNRFEVRFVAGASAAKVQAASSSVCSPRRSIRRRRLAGEQLAARSRPERRAATTCARPADRLRGGIAYLARVSQPGERLHRGAQAPVRPADRPRWDGAAPTRCVAGRVLRLGSRVGRVVAELRFAARSPRC